MFVDDAAEIIKLRLHGCLGGEQMVCAGLDAGVSGVSVVVGVLFVEVTVAFGGFDVGELYLRVTGNGWPVDDAVVVGDVDAVVGLVFGGLVAAGHSVIDAVEDIGQQKVENESECKQTGNAQ